MQSYTHTRLTALFPGLPGWAGTRKVKPIWILLKRETVSGSGISWAICKSAPCFRQITTPAPYHSVFYRPDALSAAQPPASKHWRHFVIQSYSCCVFILLLPLSCCGRLCVCLHRAGRGTAEVTAVCPQQERAHVRGRRKTSQRQPEPCTPGQNQKPLHSVQTSTVSAYSKVHVEYMDRAACSLICHTAMYVCVSVFYQTTICHALVHKLQIKFHVQNPESLSYRSSVSLSQS